GRRQGRIRVLCRRDRRAYRVRGPPDHRDGRSLARWARRSGGPCRDQVSGDEAAHRDATVRNGGPPLPATDAVADGLHWTRLVRFRLVRSAHARVHAVLPPTYLPRRCGDYAAGKGSHRVPEGSGKQSLHAETALRVGDGGGMSTFVLHKDSSRERVLERLIGFLRTLPTSKAWRVEVVEYRRRRSQEQNAYLWGVCYATILREGGEALGGWTADDLHEYFLGEWSGW